MSISPLQWAGIALMVAGVLVYVWPRIVAVLATWPVASGDDADDESIDDLLARFERLAKLQADLEVRGHDSQAADAGTWYQLLRDPIRDQEAPRP